MKLTMECFHILLRLPSLRCGFYGNFESHLKLKNTCLRYSKIGRKILNMSDLRRRTSHAIFCCTTRALERPIVGVEHRSVWQGLLRIPRACFVPKGHCGMALLLHSGPFPPWVSDKLHLDIHFTHPYLTHLLSGMVRTHTCIRLAI